MALGSKTRNILEGLVREGSFKWLLSNKSPFDEEFEEMGRSPSARRHWISELSPLANLVVRKCSRILGVPAIELQENFNSNASDSLKHASRYARNFLEYCCFRALGLYTQVTGYLGDKNFRRLTYDMMLAWEAPAAASQPLVNVDNEVTVGAEAFSRIAPAIPIVANVIITDNLFDGLTASTAGRLQFSIYEKYLCGLERAIKKMKSQSGSSLLSDARSARGEKILEVDGTITTQPVLQHVGISMWPGRLVLTDHALYFEPLRVVTFDKPKVYDLSENSKQIVKPELTGPWGTRLFDKAVFYKSVLLSEPVVFEFPELKGHSRRDYWIAIIREILFAHRFIHKYNVTGAVRDEAILKAVLGILRLQALQDIGFAVPLSYEAVLMFSLCDQLPGGDVILETLSLMSAARELDRTNNSESRSGMYSVSALNVASNLGLVFGTSSNVPNEAGLVVGEIIVGQMTALEVSIKEARSNHKKVVKAQESVDGAKVEGIDTNLAVMKELLFPVMELGKCLMVLAQWDDPKKSLVFCLAGTYIIVRGWLRYVLALLLIFIAVFMVLTRYSSQGRPVDGVKVIAPPPMNKMEQLLAVQNAISQAEVLTQDGNIFLLKFRALLLSLFPQASEKFALALLLTALVLAFIPGKYIILLVFLETFTWYSPPRKTSTERRQRRIREWWFSIPAAPVILERESEEKKVN
ncbi:Protein of unknown function DUF639 [Dillenia turbinata]|uniref:Uncharacterized protein n=1 Tax=Dillenia turbinata TaxID=194707 RepID=A0AAN8UXT6_9MAGN